MGRGKRAERDVSKSSEEHRLQGFSHEVRDLRTSRAVVESNMLVNHHLLQETQTHFIVLCGSNMPQASPR